MHPICFRWDRRIFSIQMILQTLRSKADLFQAISSFPCSTQAVGLRLEGQPLTFKIEAHIIFGSVGKVFLRLSSSLRLAVSPNFVVLSPIVWSFRETRSQNHVEKHRLLDRFSTAAVQPNRPHQAALCLTDYSCSSIMARLWFWKSSRTYIKYAFDFLLQSPINL